MDWAKLERLNELGEKLYPSERILCNTPELASEHGVVLGVTVIRRLTPPFPALSWAESIEYQVLRNSL